jgi:predicted O-linked N-acetylglucosamine transferase (SPINDLY family)
MAAAMPRFITAQQLPPQQREQLARAMSHHERGDIGAAEALYRGILSSLPYCIDALHFLGLAALQRGAVNEGIANLRQALALNPTAPAILCNLGRALIDHGDAAAALEACEAAIALEPANPQAWFFHANALQLAEAHERALVSYDRALALVPAFAAALNNRAHSLRMLRRSQDALEPLAHALAMQPSYALALNNQGLALLDLNRAEDALLSFDRALAVSPSLAEALSNRATALSVLKRFAEAAEAFERLAAAAPGFPGVLGNLLFARRNCCDWRQETALRVRVQEAVQRGELADLPLSFLYTSDSPAAQLQCARTFCESRYPARPLPPAARITAEHSRIPAEHSRIRVAYLSGDFGEHAVSRLLAPIIEHHDRSRFETIGVGWGRQDQGPMRRRLESAFEHFIDATTLSDRDIATLLRERAIDIAVDLMGHTHGQRTGVFARRPAAIQVNFLGYPGTMGAAYMDYVIADAVVIPPGEERHYSEHVVRLPDGYLPLGDGRAPDADVVTRRQAGLPAAGFVFCAFNSATKFTPEVFQLWLRLLQQVPGSVLWLRTGSAEARANVAGEARRAGIDPGRLVFAGALESIEAHLARHRLADLFLDTTPYNAHSTACDALRAGLPLLTLRGGSFAGRVGASLLEALRLPELIASSLKDYESKALEFARQPVYLGTLRRRLMHLRSTSPLFDPGHYARHLEAAYQFMWTRQRGGAAPASFEIPGLS